MIQLSKVTNICLKFMKCFRKFTSKKSIVQTKQISLHPNSVVPYIHLVQNTQNSISTGKRFPHEIKISPPNELASSSPLHWTNQDTNSPITDQPATTTPFLPTQLTMQKRMRAKHRQKVRLMHRVNIQRIWLDIQLSKKAWSITEFLCGVQYFFLKRIYFLFTISYNLHTIINQWPNCKHLFTKFSSTFQFLKIISFEIDYLPLGCKFTASEVDLHI